MKMMDRIKEDLPRIKADFTKAETWIRTMVVAVVTGASADVLQVLRMGHDVLFTNAGMVLLEHTFIGGAVVSLIGLFTKSPISPRPGEAAPPVLP